MGIRRCWCLVVLVILMVLLVNRAESLPPRPLAVSVIKNGDQINLTLDPKAHVAALLLLLQPRGRQLKADLNSLKKTNSTCPTTDPQVVDALQWLTETNSGAQNTGFEETAAKDTSMGETLAEDTDSEVSASEDSAEIAAGDTVSTDIAPEDNGSGEIAAEQAVATDIAAEEEGSGEIAAEDNDSGEFLPSETETWSTFAEDIESWVTGPGEVFAEAMTDRGTQGHRKRRFRNCQEVQEGGHRHSGVYTVYPSHGPGVTVYCDLHTDDGGWTVIQRRDHQFCPEEDFYRPWDDYVRGFGNVSLEFWLGLENIHDLTVQAVNELRVDLENFKNKTGWAKYGLFKVRKNTTDYRLWVKDYSGTAGDGLRYHNRAKFSTKDRDHDTYVYNCAETYKGAWWYVNCHQSNPNGLWAGPFGEQSGKYIVWAYWEGITPIKRIQLMVRPVRKKKEKEEEDEEEEEEEVTVTEEGSAEDEDSPFQENDDDN